jgi:alkylated DNA repair dioxygenase AlkB
MDISGLSYIENYINMDDEKSLIEFINSKPWLNDLSRRTQHYGYKYLYDSKNKLEKTEDIPLELSYIKDKISTDFNKTFDQLIVNEYNPGQGISYHTDNIKLFDDTIISLSLGSQCYMNFKKDDQEKELLLKRGSLLILQGDARYKWKHMIPSRKKDYGVEPLEKCNFSKATLLEKTKFFLIMNVINE